jgi:16S rRNA G966 N2-methylase RsmD
LKFDLIFSDPPYGKELAAMSIELVADFNLLSDKGLMVVEYAADENLNSDRLNCIRKINYGNTTNVSIFQAKINSPDN